MYGCGSAGGGGGGGGGGSSTTIYTLTLNLTTESLVTTEAFGTVETSPQGRDFPDGTLVILTAEAASGHVFSSWEGALSTIMPTTVVSMDSSKAVTAYFRLKSPDFYAVNVYASPDSTGTVFPVTGVYQDVSSETFIATADSSHVFDRWEIYGASGSSGSLSNPMYISSITETLEVFAVFKNLYTLRCSVTPEGTGTVEPWGGSYKDGSVVTLDAVPDTDFGFKQWSGDISGTVEPYTLVVNSNKNITAEFQDTAHYPLTVNVSPAGLGTVEPWGGLFDKDSYVLLTAEPIADYMLSSWSGDASGTANPLSLQMTSVKNVTANFVHIPTSEFPLNITISPDAGAGHTHQFPAPVSGNLYYVGTDVLISADANSGHIFDHWEGALTGSVNPANITMDSTKEVIAVYKHLYTLRSFLTLEACGLHDETAFGCGTVEPWSGTYVEGTTVSLTATTEWGFLFKRWIGASGSDTSAVVTVDANKAITAEIAAKTWEVVGTRGFTGGEYGADFTSLFLNSTGVPYLAYSDSNGSGTRVSVRKFSGGNWSLVGADHFSDPQDSAQSNNDVSLFISSSDTPYVASNICTPDYPPTHYGPSVYKYEGASWTQVGNKYIIYGTLEARCLSIQMYGTTPYIAFIDPYFGNKVTVMKYTTTWEVVGSRGFTAGSTECVSFAIDQSDGTPYIAFKDYTVSGKPSVMKWDSSGSTWEVVGSAGSSSNMTDIAYVSLSVNNGAVYIVCGSSFNLRVYKYDGSWSSLGTGSLVSITGPYISDKASIFIYDSIPYVAGQEKKDPDDSGSFLHPLSVWRYNGTRWIRVGPRCFTLGRGFYSSLFIKDNILYVGYSDGSVSFYKGTVEKFEYP